MQLHVHCSCTVASCNTRTISITYSQSAIWRIPKVRKRRRRPTGQNEAGLWLLTKTQRNCDGKDASGTARPPPRIRMQLAGSPLTCPRPPRSRTRLEIRWGPSAVASRKKNRRYDLYRRWSTRGPDYCWQWGPEYPTGLDPISMRVW